jgi:hypothetical protein
LNLGQKKQIVDEGEYAGTCVFPYGQRFRFRRMIGRSKPRTRPSALVPVVIAVAERGSIAVIHRRGVNPALIVIVLTIATLSTATTATVIGWATTASPPASSSASGGTSRSSIHKFSLVAYPQLR